MTNEYVQILEKMVGHMKLALSQNSSDVARSDYLLWLDFLKKIYPESELLKEMPAALPRMNTTDNDFGKPVRQTSDIREIMLLAEKQQYPTWFIQPKFNVAALILEYKVGEIKNVSEHTAIPKIIEGFTGKISGQMHNSDFIADDIDSNVDFLKKIEWLESKQIKVPEFVLFPTNKIPTVSSSKLEALFQNYTSKARNEGLNVDGVVIVSDNPLFEVDEQTSSRRIAFTVS